MVRSAASRGVARRAAGPGGRSGRPGPGRVGGRGAVSGPAGSPAPQRAQPSRTIWVDTGHRLCGPGNVTLETHFMTRRWRTAQKAKNIPACRAPRDRQPLPPASPAMVTAAREVTAGPAALAARRSAHFSTPGCSAPS